MHRYDPDFFKVRLELAREALHPAGDAQTGYEFVAPLDQDGCIRADKWEDDPDACVARFFTPNAEDRHGILERTEDGEWYFDYDVERVSDDEYGYRFGEERFVTGEYISIADRLGKMHTYKVISTERP